MVFSGEVMRGIFGEFVTLLLPTTAQGYERNRRNKGVFRLIPCDNKSENLINDAKLRIFKFAFGQDALDLKL